MTKNYCKQLAFSSEVYVVQPPGLHSFPPPHPSPHTVWLA